ncbi:MAG: cytochrome c oxidase accessory protein CcoG [Cytophagales bacterium]|nr:cytochrome c oxidase accessory protein CcoG [Cytophagales bacterium]
MTAQDKLGAIEVVSLYASEAKIYPRTVRGFFSNWRWALVFLTQLIFYGLPWLEWGSRQAVVFDLGARRFFIFNLVLYPQDFIYLTGILVISALSLFLFTAVAGRLWCGYACPQTVYTEIFLWVERKIEGDRTARSKLDHSEMSLEKLVKKWFKHLIWIGIGLWTGFTFVGYFTPIRSLALEFFTTNMGSWEVFWVFFYGFATYGNAGFMREQVCKYMCPYARFQSAMFDKDTLIVTYDQARGEPRGARHKSVDATTLQLGACVDCTLCVQVCPTGIDIRKGLQYECIGCGACADVCDTVMDKMGYAKGLVKYSTQHAMSEGLSKRQILQRVMRPRVLVYTLILVTISFALMTSLALRKNYKVDVVRDRGSLARLVEDGQIENVFRLQFMNASESAQRYTVSVSGLQGIRLASNAQITVDPTESRWVALRVVAPQESAAPGSHSIYFDIALLDAQQHLVEKAVFIIPR